MKILLLLILSFGGQLLLAQTFVEIDPAAPFVEVAYSSLAFSDIDGDNDNDVLIIGQTESFEEFSKLYINDGEGNFTESSDTPFEGVYWGAVAFSDIDGDSDQDVLILGEKDSDIPITNLYINNGGGQFTQQATPIENVRNGSIAFADVDGDNDQDVFITGENLAEERIAKLYINNGAGFFSESMDTPFEGVVYSSIAFSDVDGDNDQDILVAGLKTAFGAITKLYINDGSGIFSEKTDTPFVGVNYCSVAFSDVDGDDDQDVLIAGFKTGGAIAKLYTNDGEGNFIEFMTTPFEGVAACSVAFSDVDGDNDEDVVITGQNNSNTTIAKLYLNDGLGNFIEWMNTPFVGVANSSIAFSDVDGDEDQDILLTGRDISSDHFSKLYINESMVSSTENHSEILNFEFSIYPNPSQLDKINLGFTSNVKGTFTMTIYDIKGLLVSQQLEQINIGEQLISLDISLLKKGNYFMQLKDGRTEVVRKFRVQ